MEFTLTLDLGKQQGVESDEDGSIPVDRVFIARALTDLAATVATGARRGSILDETGLEVGSWQFALQPFAGL